MKLLAIVPARSGSKSIPHKNVRSFCGKPLLAYSVEAARLSGAFERVIVSTDDPEYAAIARGFGAEVPFLRPKELAQDTSTTAEVVQSVIRELKAMDNWQPEGIFILEPTSPERRSWHIQEAVRLFVDRSAASLASVSRVPHHYHPAKILRMDENGSVCGGDGTPIGQMKHRRQELSRVYAFNGLLWACRTELILQSPPTLWGTPTVGYLVEEKYAVDINEPEDWEIAEWQHSRLARAGL